MRTLVILFCFSLITSLSTAQNTDQSLAPYFQVNATEGPGVETLPLRSTSAAVNIAGVIADVLVTQVYENTGQTPIEAIYVFPGSSRSAVYAMQMKIGERIIEAEIQEKQAARETYETAKQEGKRASLLEQERPNVFQMNVANILPGDRIEVQLRYTELLIPEQGVYQFVYPTVVGPRYTEGTEHRNNGFTAMPYTQMGTAPLYDFNLEIYLDGGMPLQAVSSSTHDISVQAEGNKAVQISLLETGKRTGNRDFILDYSFRGDEIQTGILVFDDGDEQFFLCMAQPPKQIEADLIPPREYVFLMDVSGSMRGFPLTVSKSLMRNLISQLRPEDAFNIMVFAGGSQWWSTVSVSATQENLQAAEHFLNNLQGGGGTRLLPALQQCLDLPRYRPDVSRSVIVVSDGYVSVEDEAFELVRNSLNEANLFSFGIGSSVNRHLMEGLAYAGQGHPFIVTDQEAAEVAATKLSRYIQHPLFTQINARFEGGFEAYELEPNSLPDVFGERPVILFGKFNGKPKGEIVLDGYARVKTEAKPGIWPFRKEQPAQVESKRVALRIDVGQAKHDDRNAALKYLWAREKIRNLSDFKMSGLSDKEQQEVTQLGLDYNLLTNFTSFVAVEKEISNENPDELVPVKQTLPLPHGVNNSAIGFELELLGISGEEFLTEPVSSNKYIVLVALLLIGLLFILGWRMERRFLTIALFVISVSMLASCTSGDVQVRQQPFSEVTFILGEDQKASNAYYSNALQFYSTDEQAHTPLIVKECRSLKEIMDYLRQHPPIDGPWQKINLVVHGNEWTGVNLPIVPEGPRCTPGTLAQLALLNEDWTPLDESLLDECTVINIIGCNVGKNRTVLTNFRTAIAGNRPNAPEVRSALHFNIFRQANGQMNRHLAESCFVNFPAGKFPGNRRLEEQFSAKYPDHLTNWKKALITLAPQSRPQPYVHYFNIPVEWAVIYKDENSRPTPQTTEDVFEWVQQQTELVQAVADISLPIESFRWELTPTVIQGRPAIRVEGQTIIYCILHPIFNDKQEYKTINDHNLEYIAVVP